MQFREDLFKAQIIFRKWKDCVVEFPEGELRGFVHKKNLNALTQYFTVAHFPFLSEHKEDNDCEE